MTHGKGQLQDFQNETVNNRAMSMSPKQYSKKTVRLPDDLWEQAQAAADRNGRSLNAEITARLVDAYAQPTVADLLLEQRSTQQLVRQVLQEIELLHLHKDK